MPDEETRVLPRGIRIPTSISLREVICVIGALISVVWTISGKLNANDKIALEVGQQKIALLEMREDNKKLADRLSELNLAVVKLATELGYVEKEKGR
jgi:hypothetical protein